MLKGAFESCVTKLKSTQVGMKHWYDEKLRERSFNPGNPVLILLPVAGQPLQARFSEPYTYIVK